MKLFNPVPSAKLKKYPLGSIFQFFGENPYLYWRAIQTIGHNGIDIVGPEGTPVCAAHDGTVSEINYNPNLGGWMIQIMADMTQEYLGEQVYVRTIYGHLKDGSILVKQGDKVKAKQQIAGMGNTGFVISGNTPYWGNAPAGKGVHLHFGTYFYDLNIVKKFQNNGYQGAIDPLFLIEVDSQTKILTILENVKALYWYVKNKLKN